MRNRFFKQLATNRITTNSNSSYRRTRNSPSLPLFHTTTTAVFMTMSSSTQSQPTPLSIQKNLRGSSPTKSPAAQPPSILITVYLQKKFIFTNDEEDEIFHQIQGVETLHEQYYRKLLEARSACVNAHQTKSDDDLEEGEDDARSFQMSKFEDIGREESHRLLNSLTRFLSWVRLQSAKHFHVIHLLDQNSVSDDPAKNERANSLIYGLNDGVLLNDDGSPSTEKREHFLHLSGVNAFQDTDLDKIITNIIGNYTKNKSSDKDDEDEEEDDDNKPKISVIGLHTESSIMFLMYELTTRYPMTSISTCSALTASRSRLQHFNSLNQLKTLFNVKTFDSVYDFEHYILTQNRVTPTLDEEEMALKDEESDEFLQCGIQWSTIGENKARITTIEKEIICSLYRDSSQVRLKMLSGGNTGSWVFKVSSKDFQGNVQSATVLKIGNRRSIVRERVNFERVEDILGNNAPRVQGFTEYGDKAGIKFAYASMMESNGDGDENAEQASFRSLYMSRISEDKVKQILNTTFLSVLGRFYAGATLERVNLFQLYDFDGRGWNYRIGGTDNPSVVRMFIKDYFCSVEGCQAYVEKDSNPIPRQEMIGTEPYLQFPTGMILNNPVAFFAQHLDWIKHNSYLTRSHHYIAYQHGDLNGRNIILDHSYNVWLIDFEYTERTHVLKDITKLENDILYEYTPIENMDVLKQALLLTEELLKVKDLSLPLPETVQGVTDPGLTRAWRMVIHLRSITKSIVRDDKSSFQIEVVLLRYALFSVSLHHLSPLQKTWALAAASGYAQLIQNRAFRNKNYHLNFVSLHPDPETTRSCGRLAISILPGRKDRMTSIEKDVGELKAQKISKVLCLCSQFEVEKPSLESLIDSLSQNGIELKLFSIAKNVVPTVHLAEKLCEWLYEAIETKHENVAVVSLSGLGRSGTLAACFICYRDPSISPETAIKLVRDARGERAIDSEQDQEFVHTFHDHLKQERGAESSP